MDEPVSSVRVEVESQWDPAASPSAPRANPHERRNTTGVAMVGALLTAAVLLVASWATSPPDTPVAEQPTPEAPSEREALPDAVGVGTSDQQQALALAIDSFDRITYTTASPPLTSIHRGAEAWFSIDAGLLYRSVDLISWVVTSDLWKLRALALDSSSGDALGLLETEQKLRVQPLDGQSSIAEVDLDGEAIMGALRYPHWAIVEVDADGYWLTAGYESKIIDRSRLAALPTGVAINDQLLLLSSSRTDDSDTDAGVTVSQILSRPTGQGSIWCVDNVRSGTLSTSGDGVVHLASDTVVSTVDGALILSKVDSDLLEPLSLTSAAPLATGEGWSVTTGIGTDRPTVWTSRDGKTFDRIEVPRSKGQPVRVVWAYLDASEGLGVKVSDVALTNGLLRVGDPRTRHPRPQDLDRATTVAHTPHKTTLRLDPTRCGNDLLSLPTPGASNSGN